jgi:hypothetical protein
VASSNSPVTRAWEPTALHNPGRRRRAKESRCPHLGRPSRRDPRKIKAFFLLERSRQSVALPSLSGARVSLWSGYPDGIVYGCFPGSHRYNLLCSHARSPDSRRRLPISIHLLLGLNTSRPVDVSRNTSSPRSVRRYLSRSPTSSLGTKENRSLIDPWKVQPCGVARSILSSGK